jgi:hypothetical protein
MQPPPAVVAHLWRRGPHAKQLAGWFGQGEALANFARQQLGLVEAARAQAVAMERHRCNPMSGQSLDHDSFGHQEGEWWCEASPALVLEPVDGLLDGSFVCNGGTKARKGLQTIATAALVASGWQLDAAAAAQWLLEAPNAVTTPLAQPRSNRPAPATARRQEQFQK